MTPIQAKKCRSWHLITWGNFFWQSHDAALNQELNLTISRHLPPNNKLDLFSLKSLLSLLRFLCRVGANRGATAPLSPAAQENYICFLKSEALVPLRDILFLPAADSKHAPAATPQIALTPAATDTTHTLSVSTNSLTWVSVNLLTPHKRRTHTYVTVR